MRHVLAACAAATLAACASTGTPAPVGTAQTQTTAQVNIAGSATASSLGTMVNQNTGQSAAIAAAPDAVYAALVGAYETLGLPLSFKDDAQRRAGNLGFKSRRNAGKIPMRFAVDCGEDLNGPKADTYEITLSIESSVAANASSTGSDLLTVVNASGKPVTTSGAEIPCSTRGEIERSLVKAVNAKLGVK